MREVGRKFGIPAGIRSRAIMPPIRTPSARYRPKCEHYLPLDIRTLARRGLLEPGRDVLLPLQAPESGRFALLRLRVRTDYLLLRSAEARIPARVRRFPIEWLPCRYGGARPYFRCPQCESRRLTLYAADGSGAIVCRLCMGLVYASQDERKMDRLWRREEDIKRRLGGRFGKPKGMHWSTYGGIAAELRNNLGRQHRLFIDGARRLLDRIGWPPETITTQESPITDSGGIPDRYAFPDRGLPRRQR